MCRATKKQRSRRQKEHEEQQQRVAVQQNLPSSISEQFSGMAEAAGGGSMQGVCLCLVCCCLIVCSCSYLFVAFKKTLV